MRSNPLWGFVALILAAIIVTGVVAKKHPNNGAPTVAEQEQEEAEKAQKAAEARKNAADKMASDAKSKMMTFDQAKEGAVHATMEVEGKGIIQMELYPKAAPATVAHFVELAKKHFYDGILFHRVVPGFVIQAGDPTSKGMDGSKMRDISDQEVGKQFGLGSGGSGKNVPLEARLPHKQYSVGLARSQAPDSGDSQFYINLKDNDSLDGQYCVFGMVVQGQDVGGKIQQGDMIKSLTIQ